MTRATLPVLAAALVAAPALWAQETTPMGSGSGVLSLQQYDQAISAEEALDADVYSMEQTYKENTWLETKYWNAIDYEWAEVGEVEDLVLSRNGQLIGLVVETGGWLDIGDNSYVIDLRDVRVVDAGGGEVAFVTRLTQEEMEQRPEVEGGIWD